jgi:hypothetical protein
METVAEKAGVGSLDQFSDWSWFEALLTTNFGGVRRDLVALQKLDGLETCSAQRKLRRF